VMALSWIKENIESFGGDADQVCARLHCTKTIISYMFWLKTLDLAYFVKNIFRTRSQFLGNPLEVNIALKRIWHKLFHYRRNTIDFKIV